MNARHATWGALAPVRRSWGNTPHGEGATSLGNDRESERHGRCSALSGMVNAKALLVGSAAVYALVVRPSMLRWGASDDEVRRPYPGANLIPGGRRGATMAVTIDAPPSSVWPWLVQMGCDRAGWYSWDRLDNGGVPSAERIHPEWQRLSVGDRLASTPGGRAWFEVAALESERFLGLRASIDLRSGRPFDPAGPRPRFYVEALWGFHLTQLPDGRTRLVVSGYASARPRLLQAIADLLFWEPAHWIMQRRQFTNLTRRAERSPQPLRARKYTVTAL